jgi:hypothetical protein
MNQHDRRQFLQTMSFGSAALVLTTGGVLTGLRGVAAEGMAGSDFAALTQELLADWCDGMLKHQIHAPDDPKRHGALACPACNMIHGRCWEAVYPFLRRARTTGDQKFLDAAIKVYDWAKNVTTADGRWTNDMDPKSWAGTSIFGGIALAEALHFHGDLLGEVRRKQWTQRLDQAAEGYLTSDFTTIDFTNINYGFTAVYGFHLIGRVLGKRKFVERSHELAARVKEFFTAPNKLLFGEGKPHNSRSGRGLLPVDLGYNVEESLNGVILYALAENDKEMLKLLTDALNGHLQFMLPDGAWDNSWGTRQAKWSYWGSRTADGCQPGFSLMADRNPAFGTAAYKNAELLRRCTADGLLHGGPHYVSHGVKPCIHHTFAHAKALAFLQDKQAKLPKIGKTTPLPRETADGVKSFPELAVWLAARGPWRATVSAYDAQYRIDQPIQQATGGSLAVLYHDKVGPLFAASMAEYILVEVRNMQRQPGEDFPLTPRIETKTAGKWFTNLWDLQAEVSHNDNRKAVEFNIKTTLRDRDRRAIADDVSKFDLQYSFDASKTTITAKSSDGSICQAGAALVLPVISPSGEPVRQVSARRIEISKPAGTVVIEATVPLTIKPTEKGRVFNMVPGCEAVPIIVQLPKVEGMKAVCMVSVI